MSAQSEPVRPSALLRLLLVVTCGAFYLISSLEEGTKEKKLKKKKTLKRQQHNSTTHTHECTHTLLHGVRVCETRRAYT